MCDTPFKTPLPYTPKGNDYFYSAKSSEKSDKSDSEESTASTQSEGSSSGFTGSSNDLTIVAVFDDLMRLIHQQRSKKVEDAFLNFCEETKKMWQQSQEVMVECKRLQNIVDIKIHEVSELEHRLKRARQLLDEEKKKVDRVEREKDEMEEQIEQVRNLLFRDERNKSAEEVREKLAFLNKGRRSLDGNGYGKTLPAIQEINSTGSILSDFSVSQSEDDLNCSRQAPDKSIWRKHKFSTGGAPEPAVKKRRSSGSKVVEINPTETVRATTTLVVSKEGPITATSVIESVPKTGAGALSDGLTGSDDNVECNPAANLVFDSWARESPRKPPRSNVNNQRPHSLQQKTVVMPDSCICCQKRIRFGKSALKCKDCRSVCHLECKDSLPLPCVPLANTPSRRNLLGVISEYTPTTPPMVPGLIIHCVNEVESRGLNELGLYRIPGSEKDVKALKEKFIRARGAPNLSQVDIHVICGCVKDFLRSLTDPIITYALWRDFVQAVEAKDPQDAAPALYQCVSELPQPNRDTLAYMILHLQRIAESKECKMPVDNLAKVFGPTIVGFSSDDPNPNNLLSETRQQIMVMEHLIRLPSDYWSSFINVSNSQPSGRLQQTPSTDSLLRHTNRMFTPSTSRTTKKQKYFSTPPAYK